MEAKKKFLFEGTTPWIKMAGDEDFKVLLGCFDGVEICVLVETYIQSKLTNTINKKEVRLCHVHGLGIFIFKNKV